jgi:AcrR family transcriptional regulator
MKEQTPADQPRTKKRNVQGSGQSRTLKKNTREKILEAAKIVFAKYPYYAASIRMIGKAAGLDHPLISYYFPTKADLFEAVLEDIVEQYYQANITWFAGLEKLSPSDGLSLYIDRLFEFALNHPEALRIIAINLIQAEESEIIPGYQRIQDLYAKTSLTFKNAVPLRATTNEIEMFTQSFNTLVINFLGAGIYYAGILDLDPRSFDYLKWVKETLMFLLLPRLRRLTAEENEE